MLDLDKKNILIFAKNVLVLESTGHGARRVAAIMHMPAGTVKSHLKRGRDKLETFLKQNGYEKE